jgi:hypothetical protein
MRYLLTVAGAAHLGSFDELRVSRLTAPENTGASTKTPSLYGQCAAVLSKLQRDSSPYAMRRSVRAAFSVASLRAGRRAWRPAGGDAFGDHAMIACEHDDGRLVDEDGDSLLDRAELLRQVFQCVEAGEWFRLVIDRRVELKGGLGFAMAAMEGKRMLAPRE